ncbi:MAG: polyprenyl synthetase family protein [Desulfovibrionaceae bacterium]
MDALVRYFAAEQPIINTFLHAEADKLDPVVAPVARHVLGAGGKRLRPLLTLLTARALGQATDNAYPLACGLEMLHSATLLHDDIIDGADLRRGVPTAHTTFGTTLTVLAGDILLALANSLAAAYGDPRLNAAMADAIVRTATGEIQEIAHLRNAGLTREQYLEIITGKTAYLIMAACRCGALLAHATDDQLAAAEAFGLNLGIAFQLVDDALDYGASREVAGKPVGADLREGKLTLPLILYLERADAAQRQAFAARFTANSFTDDDIALLTARVAEQGFDAATRDFAGTYLDKAAAALARFPASEERSLLEQALAYVQNRDK